jgi:hypothetical protein
METYMQYLNLQTKHENLDIQENLIVRNGKLYFQHIRRLTNTTSEYTVVPIDIANFVKTANQAQFPDENYVPDYDETHGVQTLAAQYVIDLGTPRSKQSKPCQEAYVYLWPRKDGSMGIGITLEDADFRQILDPRTQNEVLELLKQNEDTVNQSVA